MQIKKKTSKPKIGNLLFGTLPNQEIYQLFSQKGNAAHNSGGFGKIFSHGYLNTALKIIEKPDKQGNLQKELKIIDPAKLIEIAKVLHNTGELTAKNKKHKLKKPYHYKALLCYAMILHECRNGNLELDFHERQQIQQTCMELLALESLKKSKFEKHSLLDIMAQQLAFTQLKTKDVLTEKMVKVGKVIDDSAHSASFATLQNGTQVVFKEEVGNRIAGFEVVANELYRLIIGNHLPKTSRIKATSYEDSIVSEELNGFKTLGKSKKARRYFIESKFKDLAKILVASLFLQENDLHENNIGICKDKDGKYCLVKIDGDQALFAKFTGSLAEFDYTDKKEIRSVKEGITEIKDACFLDGFGIHHQDLENLTKIGNKVAADDMKASKHGQKARFVPYNSICYGIDDEFDERLQQAAKSKAFTQEKFFAFLKVYLLPKSLVRSIIGQAIENSQDQDSLNSFIEDRQQAWLEEILLVPGFKQYLEKQGLKDFKQITQEVHVFLASYRDKRYLISNNLNLDCYDTALDTRFQMLLETAGLDKFTLEKEPAHSLFTGNFQRRVDNREVKKTNRWQQNWKKAQREVKQIIEEDVSKSVKVAQEVSEDLARQTTKAEPQLVMANPSLQANKQLDELSEQQALSQEAKQPTMNSSKYNLAREQVSAILVTEILSDFKLKEFYHGLQKEANAETAKSFFMANLAKLSVKELLELGQTMQAVQEGGAGLTVKQAFRLLHTEASHSWQFFSRKPTDWQEVFGALKQAIMFELKKQAKKDGSGQYVLEEKLFNQAHAIMHQGTGRFLIQATVWTGTHYSHFSSQFRRAETEHSLLLLSRANLRK